MVDIELSKKLSQIENATAGSLTYLKHPKSEWRYKITRDVMRKTDTVRASLMAFERADRPSTVMQDVVFLRLDEKTSQEEGLISFSTAGGKQIDCKPRCRFAMRFDDGPVVQMDIRPSIYPSIARFFVIDESAFLKRLKASKLLIVEIPLLGVPTQILFRTAGLKWDR